jgi:hypothetical protein
LQKFLQEKFLRFKKIRLLLCYLHVRLLICHTWSISQTTVFKIIFEFRIKQECFLQV